MVLMEKMKARILVKNLTCPCQSNIPIWKAMKENGFSQSAFLILRDGELITDDEIIREGETIELISVVSGG